MGVRNADPPSPASRWLHRLEQKEQGGDVEEYAMEMEMEMEMEYETRSGGAGPAGSAKTVVTPHRHGVECEMLAQHEPTNIDEAIELASPRALRKLLRMMVYSQQGSMELARAYLMRPTQSGLVSSAKTSRKRKMYEMCQHCRIEIEPGNNREESCSYHPGQSELVVQASLYERS